MHHLISSLQLAPSHTIMLILQTMLTCADTGFGVVNCGGGHFCCHGIGECGAGCPTGGLCDCAGVSDVFSLPPGSVMTSLPRALVSETPKTSAATNGSAAQTSEVFTSVTTAPASATTTSTLDTDATNVQSSGLTSGAALSVGAKVGIGVACGTVALAALAAAMLFRIKRRRRMQTNAGSQATVEKEGQQQWSVAQQKHGPDPALAELDPQGQLLELSGANARSELDAQGQPQELSGTNTRSEL